MTLDRDQYRCPICSQLAELVISDVQAICGNESCRVFIFTPGMTAEQLLADAQVIDLDGLVNHSTPPPAAPEHRHGDPGE